MKKSIKQRAIDFAGDRTQGAGHGYPSWEANLIEKGYTQGAKDQTEIMYSEEEVKDLLIKALTHKDNGEVGNLVTVQSEIRTANFYTWFEQFKKK